MRRRFGRPKPCRMDVGAVDAPKLGAGAPGPADAEGVTRAIGPTPNSGRPVEPDARRPARGSRACTPIPQSFRGERDGKSSRARPRQSTTHRTIAERRRPRPGASPERTCSRSPVAVRQSRAMTTRRDHRPIHVRPRPPSSPRSAPVKVKPRSPGPNRLSSHRPIQRSNGLPIVFRLAFRFSCTRSSGQRHSGACR